MTSRRQLRMEEKLQESWHQGGKWVLILLGLGIVFFGVHTFTESRQKQKEMEAFSQLYEIEEIYYKKKSGFELDEVLKTQSAEELGIPEEVAEGRMEKSGSLEEDFGDVLTRLKNFVGEYNNTHAAALAGILVVDLYSQYEAWTEALPLLEEITQGQRSDNLLQGLLELGAGTAMAEAGSCDQALEQWKNILDSKKLEFLHAEAALRSGLCHENLGQFEDATFKYRLAADKAPAGSSLASSASQFLRALEIAPPEPPAGKRPL